MISRRTTKILADLFEERFTTTSHRRVGRERKTDVHARNKELHDFLYVREHDAWFIGLAKLLHYERHVLEFIMGLHTGVSILGPTGSWSEKIRLAWGQQALRKLAEHVLSGADEHDEMLGGWDPEGCKSLLRSLELDGYAWKNSQLLRAESEVLDVQEAHGIVEELYLSLRLDGVDIARNHLKLSEEHYLAGKWGDSITNTRNLLEQVLRETAVLHSRRVHKAELKQDVYKWPVEVRKYLETNGIVDERTRKTLAEVYGLLSNTGSHPNLAEKDEARLVRHLGLTLAQFVMLQLQGMLLSKSKS